MLRMNSIIFMLVGMINAFAFAQNVSFLNAKDVLAGKCFNPAANQVDAGNPNKLIIGVHTPESNSCTAATYPYFLRSLSDIMTMDVVAPTGYYISKIKYSIVASTSTTRTGSAGLNNTLIVAGIPRVLPASGAYEVDLSGAANKLTSVPVAISFYGFTHNQGTIGSGKASLTSPVIEAEILPLQ